MFLRQQVIWCLSVSKETPNPELIKKICNNYVTVDLAPQTIANPKVLVLYTWHLNNG